MKKKEESTIKVGFNRLRSSVVRIICFSFCILIILRFFDVLFGIFLLSGFPIIDLWGLGGAILLLYVSMYLNLRGD